MWIKTFCDTTQPSCFGPCNAHPYNITVRISLKCSETLVNVPKSPVKTLHGFLLTKQPSLNITKNPVLHIMLWQNFIDFNCQVEHRQSRQQMQELNRKIQPLLSCGVHLKGTKFCKLSRLVLITFIFCL